MMYIFSMFENIKPFEVGRINTKVSTMGIDEIFQNLEVAHDKAVVQIERDLSNLRGDSSLVAAKFTALGILQQKYWEYSCSNLECTKLPSPKNLYVRFKSKSGEALTLPVVPLKISSKDRDIRLEPYVEIEGGRDLKERMILSEYQTLVSLIDSKASDLGLDYLSSWPSFGSFSIRPELLIASSIIGVTGHLQALNSLAGVIQSPDSDDLYLVLAPRDQISLQARMIKEPELAVKFISANFIDLCTQLGDFCLPQDMFLSLGKHFALEISGNRLCQIFLSAPGSNSRNRKEVALEGSFWLDSHNAKEEYSLRIITKEGKIRNVKFTCSSALDAAVVVT